MMLTDLFKFAKSTLLYKHKMREQRISWVLSREMFFKRSGRGVCARAFRTGKGSQNFPYRSTLEFHSLL